MTAYDLTTGDEGGKAPPVLLRRWRSQTQRLCEDSPCFAQLPVSARAQRRASSRPKDPAIRLALSSPTCQADSPHRALRGMVRPGLKLPADLCGAAPSVRAPRPLCHALLGLRTPIQTASSGEAGTPRPSATPC
ncbi:hypothetical protein NDU88_001583 [Pleurodeles waltl]|uniref:Uncharacterized protein n=1 Tax=Pleurodeles waltl TaxID=8319 RepID=A0AAV7PCZ5_PLEWA|nr:hypothetical protein NDU88_001583 [Pleurodeles waltl]